MSIRTTTEKQNKLILENLRLVHFIVQKFNIDSNEYDDYVSIGTIGLVNAARTFNQDKGAKFSTYAMKCIKNEILKQFRKVEKESFVNVSLDMVLYIDEHGAKHTLAETIEAPNSDFITNFTDIEEALSIINIILNVLDARSKFIMLYRLAGFNQSEISNCLNMSQSHVSRVERKAKNKIKEYLITLKKYRGFFKAKKTGDLYKISFSTKNINNFDCKFEVLLKRIKNIQTGINFKINYYNETVEIIIPAELESFSFVADLTRELDDLKITDKYSKVSRPKPRVNL